ncbi:hypothetical protein M378DRAFT_171729 [Amanita muscaria Koide BX008]|uniref:Uncharacterized protein n=1 Tax=Amanita muscaria (strain Koide BX008) TaxID=946122 RepID=A0A0C2STX0_AMAMK|nr:hypothetical protein M378DRAFT_171729 [Amanita muscaria Koide BX008]
MPHYFFRVGKTGNTSINRNQRPNYHTLGNDLEANVTAMRLPRPLSRRNIRLSERRRFAKLEYLGLRRVVFCEIPIKEAGFTTVKTIFGDHWDNSIFGMTVDGLLDGVGARVVYFPSYSRMCVPPLLCVVSRYRSGLFLQYLASRAVKLCPPVHLYHDKHFS